MSFALNIPQSEHFIALLIIILIFIELFFFVVKRWIAFSLTLLFLLFSIFAGLAINNQEEFQPYLTPSSNAITEEISPEDLKKQMLQAMDDLKKEVAVEKENFRHVMDEVQSVFDSVDIQKQKLQNFIGEVRQHFKNEHSTTPQDSELAPYLNDSENTIAK